MKTWTGNNSTITHQNLSKLFRQKVHGLVHLLMHLVVKATHSVPGLFKWNINVGHMYLCEYNSKTFNAWTYFNHPWLWPVCVKRRFVFTRTVEIRGLCLQSKRSGTKYADQKINFFTSTVTNDRPLPLWKGSLGSDKFLMGYYLFIFSSCQYVEYMTSQILLILTDFDSCFAHFLIWNYFSSNLYNSGTIRDIRKQ